MRPWERKGTEKAPMPPEKKSSPKGPDKMADKNADLDKRLDRLMQELEAIRKEMRRK
jgi:hypothetical protein